MLIFGFADAAERRAKADTDAMLWMFARIVNPGIVKSELRRGTRKLRVTINPIETLRRKKLLRVPVGNFGGATHLERLRIKSGNTGDPTFLSKNSVPKTIDAAANACDRTDAGDDRASSAHAVALFALASTYAFIQRNVLLAMLRIKKSPMIGSTIGPSAGMRNRRSCEIVTSTPLGWSKNVQTTRIPFVHAFRWRKRISRRSRSMICSVVHEIGIPERRAAITTMLRSVPRSRKRM